MYYITTFCVRKVFCPNSRSFFRNFSRAPPAKRDEAHRPLRRPLQCPSHLPRRRPFFPLFPLVFRRLARPSRRPFRARDAADVRARSRDLRVRGHPDGGRFCHFSRRDRFCRSCGGRGRPRRGLHPYARPQALPRGPCRFCGGHARRHAPFCARGAQPLPPKRVPSVPRSAPPAHPLPPRGVRNARRAEPDRQGNHDRRVRRPFRS